MHSLYINHKFSWFPGFCNDNSVKEKATNIKTVQSLLLNNVINNYKLAFKMPLFYRQLDQFHKSLLAFNKSVFFDEQYVLKATAN